MQRNFCLLGPVVIEIEGQRVGQFRSHRSLALLAYLVQEERAVSRSRLAVLLWPDATREQALSNVRRTIHDLAHKLPDALEVDSGTVRFAGLGWEVDTRLFRLHMGATNESALLAAAELCRGSFLEGFEVSDSPEFEHWLDGQRELFRLDALLVHERLLALYLEQERYEEALRSAWRILAFEPWRESVHRTVMRLLVRSGRRSSALRQYEICRQVLAEELAVAPSPETERLYQRIRRSKDVASFRPPFLTGSFVGRHQELQTLLRRLADPDVRLITLSGGPGTGKTHLVLQLAKMVNSDRGFRFLDGICYVDAGSARGAAACSDLLATVLDLQTLIGEPPGTTVLDYLRDREFLLILDNLHMGRPGLAYLTQLIGAAEDLVIVAVTRERLGLPFEAHLAIGGLDTRAPEDGHGRSDALELFRHTVEHSGSEVPDGENEVIAARLCQLVAGNPVAIGALVQWLAVMDYPALWELLNKAMAGGEPAEAGLKQVQRLLQLCSARERQVFKSLGLTGRRQAPTGKPVARPAKQGVGSDPS